MEDITKGNQLVDIKLMGCRARSNLSRISPPLALNFIQTLRPLSTLLIISSNISSISSIRKERQPNAFSAIRTTSTQQKRYATITCARGMHPEGSSSSKKSTGIIRRSRRGTTARTAMIRIVETARNAGIRRLHKPLLARSISQGNDVSITYYYY